MDVDYFLEIIENSTRREILRKLIEKECYPLLLSRELNLTQQAVMKHLSMMEKRQIIKVCEYKRNFKGPPRKIYRLDGRYTLTVDLTPNMFYIEIREIPEVNDADIPRDKLKEVLEKINEELKKIEERRLELLSLKDYILSVLK